jgi:integrase
MAVPLAGNEELPAPPVHVIDGESGYLIGTQAQPGQHGMRKLVEKAGIGPRSPRCRPRPHDLRHTFAVNTLLAWYRDGLDVPGRMHLLSTYLGHLDPAATYWYLSATPELLGLAGQRLERTLGELP